MKYREIILVTMGIAIIAMLLNGCAVGMAAVGKRQKDTNVLITRTSRDRVLAEFGSPESSVTNEKGKNRGQTPI